MSRSPSLLCTFTLQEPLEREVLPAFASENIAQVDARFDSTAELMELLVDGVKADVLVGALLR